MVLSWALDCVCDGIVIAAALSTNDVFKLATIQPAINDAPPSSDMSILQRRGPFINTGNIPPDPVASLRFTLFPALL